MNLPFREFDQYRAQFDSIVKHPDFSNARENSVRRALLFLRRGPMWRELPADTKWFEVELTPEDLARIRFFPRAQWRRVSKGSFYLVDVVERIRAKLEASTHGEFFDKLRLLSYSVQEDLVVNPTVLLIGIDDKEPLTILDGNHRMAAAMLGQSGLGGASSGLSAGYRLTCGVVAGITRTSTRCCAISRISCGTFLTMRSRISTASTKPIPETVSCGSFQAGRGRPATPLATYLCCGSLAGGVSGSFTGVLSR